MVLRSFLLTPTTTLLLVARTKLVQLVMRSILLPPMTTLLFVARTQLVQLVVRSILLARNNNSSEGSR
ncbi:hypothetical protein K1719_002534 [Acacia pycnantha]|nr:hypothetical protein K1719_002534 [Acacia pycnantha]